MSKGFVAVQQRLGSPAARVQRGALAAALGVCLCAVAALYAVQSPAAAARAAELLEGFGSSGEDAALRQLYDADGERVPGAVVASQALAAADMPAEARRAVRRARDNLEDVRRAAMAAAMLKGDAAGSGGAGSTAGFDATWKAEMDKAMGAGKGAVKRGAGHQTPTHRSTRSAVARRFQDASETEQSKDMLKEQMETVMRRKMSAMELDVQRQLRDERVHQEKEERRRAKTTHLEVETLKKRMLKQREKMEDKIVELSTRAHHYKSEVDTIVNGANHNRPLEKKAQPRERAPSRSQRKITSGHDDGVRSLVAKGKREEKLEEEVKNLKAEFAKQEAMWKDESKQTVRKEPFVEGNGNSAKVQKIEKIEKGYFSGSGVSSGVARSQMQDIVARERARKAAEKKRAVRRVLRKAAHVDATAKAVSAFLPPPKRQALSAQNLALSKPATASRAGDARTVATASETPLAATTEGPGAAAGGGATGGADAELKAKLREAIAERNAAEVEAEGYVLQAKDREIAALERELAINQRVLALKQMQEENPALETTGPLFLPGAGPELGGSVEASVRPASVGDPRAAVDSSEGERMVFGEQDSAQGLGGYSAAVGSPVQAGTLESSEPSMAGEGRGFPAQRGVDNGVASGGKQPQQVELEHRPRSVLRPQRSAKGGRSEGWRVDHVPVWSARVKALEQRALADGFQLVPAHGADEHGMLSGQTTSQTLGRAGPAMMAPQGRQALAAVKTTASSPPRDVEAASEVHPRDTAVGHAIIEGASDRESSSGKVPQGLNGASLLDQIGREFFQGAKSFLKAV